MKIDLSLLLLAASLGCASVGTTGAATALIDFGMSDAPSPPYNLVLGPSAAQVPLLDTSGAGTGWTVNVTETGSGNGGTAGAGANVNAFPADLLGYNVAALRDSIFANQGAGSTPSMVLTFAGLNASASYDLLLYGSRANAQGLDQIWSLTQGSGGADVTHFSELNDSVYVNWPGLSPSGSGVLEITLSAGADSLGALALNFGSISEAIPEPAAVTLLAFASLALLSRHRRRAD